jgi:hypothetical protein
LERTAGTTSKSRRRHRSSKEERVELAWEISEKVARALGFCSLE